MNEVFYEAATHIQSKPILAWKESGKPIIGYTCSYVPSEIFYAAGILPVRLRGIETDGMEIGDSYYGPFICSFPKCMLQLAGKGKFSFLDGAIITPGCDAMRRIDECWRKAGDDYPGIVPDFFHYFDAPHKVKDYSMGWFKQEVRDLIVKVEDHFNVTITPEKLAEAINVYNKGRRVLKRIEEIRAKKNGVIKGSDAFAATIAGTVLDRDTYNQELQNWLAEIKNKKESESEQQKLLLVGSVSDDIELVQMIEKDQGVVIAGENLCFGVRFEGNEIDSKKDPIDALAEHYLGQSVCPRMFGNYQDRLKALKEKIDRTGAEGIIMQNIRFCDLHGAENALFERDLEAEGMPCLRIEREYGPLTETGRMKLRINAFIERINRSKKKR